MTITDIITGVSQSLKEAELLIPLFTASSIPAFQWRYPDDDPSGRRYSGTKGINGIYFPSFGGEGVSYLYTPLSARVNKFAGNSKKVFSEKEQQDYLAFPDPNRIPGDFVSHIKSNRIKRIAVTEGAKKADFILKNLGVPAVSFNGCYGWSASGGKVNEAVLSLLEFLLEAGVSNIDIYFDADDPTKKKSVTAVTKANRAFKNFLENYGFAATVKVWDHNFGKGIDDISASGLKSFSHSYELSGVTVFSPKDKNPDLKKLQLRQQLSDYEWEADKQTSIQQGELIKPVLKPGHINAIVAPMGSGKTTFVAGYIKDQVSVSAGSVSVLSISHRISLAKFAASKFGLSSPYGEDFDPQMQSSCLASLGDKGQAKILEFISSKNLNKIVVIDELEQVLSFIHSGIIRNKIETFKNLVSALKSASTIIVSQALMPKSSLDAIARLSEKPVYSERFRYAGEPGISGSVTNCQDLGTFWDIVLSKINNGKKVALGVQSAKITSTNSPITLDFLASNYNVLTYSSETLRDVDSKVYKFFDKNPDGSVEDLLAFYKPDVFIFTPAIESGVSIEKYKFDVIGVVGFQSVVSTIQMTKRVRCRAPIYVYMPVSSVANVSNTQFLKQYRDSVSGSLSKDYADAVKELDYLYTQECSKTLQQKPIFRWLTLWLLHLEGYEVTEACSTGEKTAINMLRDNRLSNVCKRAIERMNTPVIDQESAKSLRGNGLIPLPAKQSDFRKLENYYLDRLCGFYTLSDSVKLQLILADMYGEYNHIDFIVGMMPHGKYVKKDIDTFILTNILWLPLSSVKTDAKAAAVVLGWKIDKVFSLGLEKAPSIASIKPIGGGDDTTVSEWLPFLGFKEANLYDYLTDGWEPVGKPGSETFNVGSRILRQLHLATGGTIRDFDIPKYVKEALAEDYFSGDCFTTIAKVALQIKSELTKRNLS
jgi:KaiC/GvpD/RAD55 family RecA-like ATPase